MIQREIKDDGLRFESLNSSFITLYATHTRMERLDPPCGSPGLQDGGREWTSLFVISPPVLAGAFRADCVEEISIAFTSASQPGYGMPRV